MQYRRLGKTDLQVSELGFGGIPILRLSTAEAVKILKHAYDKGITLYDTANAYKDSEDKIGRAFEGLRHQVILATKTMKRDRHGAAADIDNSLKMLRTDYIDLFQLHQIAQEADWQKATGPDGCLEAVVKAQQEGKIRHIGITSHSAEMAVKMLKSGLFSTIQFPFSFLEDAAKDELHPLARKLDLGILAMKPFAGGMIDQAAITFKFLRQFPDAIPIPGFDSVESVDQIVSIYQTANQITEQDLATMEKYRAELGREFCRRCEYCQPCPHGVRITPSMIYKVVAIRMSPQIAVKFSGANLDTVPQCVECGVCVQRCPYNLPIPQILKKHYAMYKEHKAACTD